MFDHELTTHEKIRILAGEVRNRVSAPLAMFSPWFELCLCWKDGMLCKTANVPSDQRHCTPLFSVEEVYEMSDEDIWHAVMGGIANGER